jgi:hypothetical protein
MNTRRRTVVRVAALVSSVVLLGVYIGCRATSDRGAAPVAPPGEAPKEEYLGGSKSREVFPPAAPPSNESREYFVGSKSAPVIRPSQPAPQQSASPR